MAKASDNAFPSVLLVEGSAPASPASGDQRLFLDTADHKLKRVNSSGTVTAVEGGGGGSAAMTQISHQVISTATATISFPSIAGSYNHLELVLYGRSNNSAINDLVNLQFNGDSSASYDYQIVYGNGGAASSVEAFAATAALAGVISGATSPTGTASGFTLEIPAYAGTTFHKTALAAGGTKQVTTTGGMVAREIALWWRSTAAITQIDLTCASGQFMAGTVATLYGLT